MAGITNGHVAARLALDREGRVKKVYVIESVLRRVLDEEAHRTFLAWTYTGSRYEWRTLDAKLEFKRKYLAMPKAQTSMGPSNAAPCVDIRTMSDSLAPMRQSVNQMAAAGQAISDAPIFDGICGATVSHGVRGDGTVNHEHLKLLKLRGGSL